MPMKKVIVLLVDCNDETKLEELMLESQKGANNLIDQFIICYSKTFKDNKPKDTSSKIQRVSSDIEVTRHSLNLGHGGDQKVVFRSIANIDSGVLVVINGEGQYSLKRISEIAQPIIRGEADVVLSSLRRHKRDLKQFSTFVNNFLSGVKFENWHSEYRAYSISSLNSINFVESPDGLSFDTDVLLQLNSAGFRIAKVANNSNMGSESAHSLGLIAIIQSLVTVIRHRLKIMGFAPSNVMPASYRFKFNEYSSHSKLRDVLQNIPQSRVLDLGCADGQLSEVAALLGHEVTAVDIESGPKSSTQIKFFQHDLENDLPISLTEKFDVVLCADILEHLRKPDVMLFKLLPRLSSRGIILVSIPNFGHWYPRIRTLLGRFDYDARGILDQTHLRFFTRRSFSKMATKAGYKVKRLSVTGTPFEVMLREAPKRNFSWSFLISTLSNIDRIFCKIRPTLFAYQFIFELTPMVPLISDELNN
ncbi:MAG: methyltransferase domain-containing protein [Actinobacteria bacterium]|nr:methyltransferase domain-containing protein [Actinomycetota bacterium]